MRNKSGGSAVLRVGRVKIELSRGGSGTVRNNFEEYELMKLVSKCGTLKTVGEPRDISFSTVEVKIE
jgi:hypothetical protein